jgi:CheY-like chemotaxis protein
LSREPALQLSTRRPRAPQNAMESHNTERAAGVRTGARTPLRDRRILVVEDDWFIADAVTGLLAKEGADVFGPAATLEEVEQLAQYWPIEMAVMDLDLNGERADDLVVELAREDITIVVVTGYEIKQPVADAAFATLPKPITSAVLLDTLQRAAQARLLQARR